VSRSRVESVLVDAKKKRETKVRVHTRPDRATGTDTGTYYSLTIILHFFTSCWHNTGKPTGDNYTICECPEG
jgi:hypothetical protein